MNKMILFFLHFRFRCECAETFLQSTFPPFLDVTVRQPKGGHIENDVTKNWILLDSLIPSLLQSVKARNKNNIFYSVHNASM